VRTLAYLVLSGWLTLIVGGGWVLAAVLLVPRRVWGEAGDAVVAAVLIILGLAWAVNLAVIWAAVYLFGHRAGPEPTSWVPPDRAAGYRDPRLARLPPDLAARYAGSGEAVDARREPSLGDEPTHPDAARRLRERARYENPDR
jgi:hypothetical protein